MMKHAKMITSPMQTLRRYALPIVLVLSILTLFSSATYAFVVSRADAIDNKFQLQTIGMELHETTEGETDQLTAKKDVKIENTAEATLYVRVKLVAQVLDKDKNPIANPVLYDAQGNIAQAGCIDFGNPFNTTDWLQVGDVYYYKTPLEADKTTNALFESATLNQHVYLYNPLLDPDHSMTEEDCPRIALTVLSEGIQVNGVKAGVWSDVTVDESGNLIAKEGSKT